MSSLSVRSARERQDLHVLASHLVALLQEHEVGLERPVYDALRALKAACVRESFSGRRPAGDVRAITVLPLDEARALCAAARIGMCAEALERHWDVGNIDTRSTGRALHAVAGAIDVAVERDAAWRRLTA
jgi:hypothetical protein